MKKSLQTAIIIRKFNRFYLPYFQLLRQKYLNTEYSAADARILYEIYEKKELCAKDIVNNLRIDKGYLSRVLKNFESKSLINRKISENDSRIMLISLTETGVALTKKLILKSNQQIEKEIIKLTDPDLDKLSYHFEEIIKILGGESNGNHSI